MVIDEGGGSKSSPAGVAVPGSYSLRPAGGCGMRHLDFRLKNGVFLTAASGRFAAMAAKLPSVGQRRPKRQQFQMPHIAAAGRAGTIAAGDCHAGGASLTEAVYWY